VNWFTFYEKIFSSRKHEKWKARNLFFLHFSFSPGRAFVINFFGFPAFGGSGLWIEK